MSNGTNTVKKSSRKESKMESLTARQFTAMSEHSSMTGTPQHIKEWLIASQGGSHVNHLALPENGRVKTMSETYGPPHSMLSTQSDPNMFFSKMCQDSFLADTLELSSKTWPKAGFVCRGKFYRQPKLERRINAIASGLWPTPRTGKISNENADSWAKRNADGKVATPPLALAVKLFPAPKAEPGNYSKLNGKICETSLQSMARRGVLQQWATPTVNTVSNGSDHNNSSVRKGRHGINLAGAARLWPTPRASANENRQTKPTPSQIAGTHGKSLAAEAGGCLNADWVEALMGWPVGMTSLEPIDKNEFLAWKAGFVNGNEQSNYGFAAWQNGSWEIDLPRVSENVTDRTNRLKAIGNGIVPLVAAVAWRILTEGDDE